VKGEIQLLKEKKKDQKNDDELRIEMGNAIVIREEERSKEGR
jgi:hypothetical protein